MKLIEEWNVSVIVGAALPAAFVAYQYREQSFLDYTGRWVRKDESPSTFRAAVLGQTIMAVVATGIGIFQLLYP